MPPSQCVADSSHLGTRVTQARLGRCRPAVAARVSQHGAGDAECESSCHSGLQFSGSFQSVS
eukprot:11677168-Alexandrium_andersonii.AAC.1